MTAITQQAHGFSQTLRYAVGASSLGHILVACSEQGLCAILLGDDEPSVLKELQARFPHVKPVHDPAAMQRTLDTVIHYAEQPTTDPGLSLDIRGTGFQKRVWQVLCDIPSGQTASYGEIARRLGRPKSVRAVARACAANPLALVIPCHRVVRQDGGLSGYRWGIERKRALLEREARK